MRKLGGQPAFGPVHSVGDVRGRALNVRFSLELPFDGLHAYDGLVPACDKSGFLNGWPLSAI